MAWIAEDPASKAVLELARKVAETSTTLLITGESGTGKDHLARLIHELGPRRDAPFLKIDCASLPQELVESELFGHERGAFTGAVERKVGPPGNGRMPGPLCWMKSRRFPPPRNPSFLRVLEERQFERLGGTETITITARLIALTNADLARLVSEGQFPRGFVFPSERADHSGAGAARASRGYSAAGRTRCSSAAPACTAARTWRFPMRSSKCWPAIRWPGNVRELRNAIERALVFSGGSALIPEDFPENRCERRNSRLAARCVRLRIWNATPFAPRSKPRTTKSARARRFWASAARLFSTNARNTD